MDRQAKELEKQILMWHRDNEASRKLEAIPGIGPAWMGLVPKQHSSGGKQNLLGISRRGDTDLRTLMIHGARAVIRFAESKSHEEGWLRTLMARRNKNVAAVALANKNARIVWALLAHERTFRPDYSPAAAGTAV